jgi:hypothetical protein
MELLSKKSHGYGSGTGGGRSHKGSSKMHVLSKKSHGYGSGTGGGRSHKRSTKMGVLSKKSHGYGSSKSHKSGKSYSHRSFSRKAVPQQPGAHLSSYFRKLFLRK